MKSTILVLLILLGLAFSACTQDNVVQPYETEPTRPAIIEEENPPAGLANPASVYCVEQGGTVVFRQGEDGEYGVCLFNDGSECGEWDFYKDYCQVGQAGTAEDPAKLSVREKGPDLAEAASTAESQNSPTTTPGADPAQKPTAEPFILAELEMITVDNAYRLQSLVGLSAPQVYWTVFSPDSSELATIAQRPADRSWYVEVWDLISGQVLHTVEGGPTVYFSPDGQQVATASEEGYLLWKAEDGTSATTLAYPNAIALAPDWQRLATNQIVDGDAGASAVSIVEVASGSSLQHFDLGGIVVDARFSPDSRLLAITTGGVSSETTVWDVATGERPATFEMVDRFIFSPDGRLIAGAFGQERQIGLLDARDFSVHLTLDNSTGPQPQYLAFSAAGDILAAALGSSVRLWDTATGQELTTIPVQAGNIAFSPDSRTLVSSNFQGEVTFWGVTP